MKPNLKDKFRGCVIGQCLGDALGFPVEGADADTCDEFIMHLGRQWYDGKISLDEFKGQYTDDSQLARELMISLVECGDFNPDDYAARINEIFHTDRIIGRGLACDAAAMRLNDGCTWREAGCPPPAAGNGTAMRAAPIGLFFHNNLNEMIASAHEQGFITHQDPRCSAGSIAIAGAVAIAIKSEFVDVKSFVDTLAGWMEPYHQGFADEVRMLNEWVILPIDKAAKVIAKAGNPDIKQTGWSTISPYVIPSVLWSLYSFLKYHENYWDAISTAIRVGGDVDTTGAMTGAISGAHLGIKAISGEISRKVNDLGQWTYTDLIQLTDRLYELAN
ncbi:MAG: ADP-ribosylglycohydrolase family protein [candidate division Zixibacteria bacterium]|nr:ADP-ribosylglycohydrolase family protein [candidate division Zixibacteria bacterium]